MSSPSSWWQIPTQDIEDVLLGRCKENGVLKPLVQLDSSVTCKTYVDHLMSVWTEDNLDITTKDYDDLFLFVNADFASPKDKSMFWAGVPKPLVNDYTNQASRFTQMVETPGGSLLTDTTFCADNYYNPITKLCYKKYTRLPAWNEMQGGFHGAQAAWWQGASREFAKGASGHTYIFFLGSSQYLTAFYDETILAKVEIPNMDANKIDKVTILFAKEHGYDKEETCTSKGSSIEKLTELLKDKAGFAPDQIECIDQPMQIELLLCVDDPDDPSCQRYRSLDVILDQKQDWIISAIVGWSMFGVLACIVVLSILLHKCRRPASIISARSLGGGQQVVIDVNEERDVDEERIALEGD